ncbi:MAG: T9SS type A sorting domain-containing protein, partial [Ignavibacteriales bacterium]|nr:T9SS type A sorting domain-containing protein [Ignavibacteriales bacterium]
SSPGSIVFSIGDFSTNYFSYAYLAYSINVFYVSITDVESDKNLSAQFELSQNYPNPFNPTTIIKYSVPNVVSNFSSNNVELKVYDVLGREIKTLVNQKQKAGNYEVSFDTKELSSGVYFYRLQSGDFIQTKKMMLLK